MKPTADLYRHSLTLLTDLYELTMAYGYWKSGAHEREACFHLFFRKPPFGGGYAVACGLKPVVDFLEDFRFGEDEVEYLASLNGRDGRPLFERGFLDYLREMKFDCDVHAAPEGTLVFPHEPLVRVRGPLIQAQLVETPLLNMINFQTLVATKAARICQAARGEPVLEFGLRRAQGVDGGLAASRAAYVGGCAGTSNVLAGKLHGIPVKGTHAHSWVMTFDTELEAFEAYAEAMPNNCVFLVDTYDTLEGVRRATEVGKKLRERGQEMIGVRLDSGDLAYLSIEARRILDEAGFPDAAIVASNDLDEHVIQSLEQQGARIDLWGVGTRLVTAHDQPALGGVYKLAAVREPGGDWEPRIKLSEQAIKISNPGIQQVRRFRLGEEFVGDVIWDTLHPEPERWVVVDPLDPNRQKSFSSDSVGEDLLVEVFDRGRKVHELAGIEEVRGHLQAQLAGFHQGIKRFVNPHQYPVGLERGLLERKDVLVRRARGIEE